MITCTTYKELEAATINYLVLHMYQDKYGIPRSCMQMNKVKKYLTWYVNEYIDYEFWGEKIIDHSGTIANRQVKPVPDKYTKTLNYFENVLDNDAICKYIWNRKLALDGFGFGTITK